MSYHYVYVSFNVHMSKGVTNAPVKIINGLCAESFEHLERVLSINVRLRRRNDIVVKIVKVALKLY